MLVHHLLTFWPKVYLNLIFRSCTDYQIMYQELSAKVDDVSLKRATNVLRKIYSCIETYDFSNINEHAYNYNLCTEKITVSNNKIHKILTEIEIFAAPQSQSSALPIRIQLGTINNIETETIQHCQKFST